MKRKKYIWEIIISCIVVGLLIYKFLPMDKINSSKSTDDDTALSFEKKMKPNKDYPEKEKVHLKLLDSIDYFKNVEGEFEEFDKLSNTKSKIDYVLDIENKKGMSSISENESMNQTVIFNEGKKISFDNTSHTYREFKWEAKSKNKELTKLSPNQRFLNKTSNNNRTDGDFLGYASKSLQSDLASLLIRYTDWNFEESKFLDFDVYKLNGSIDKEISDSFSGKFEMIIDKNTGILLDFKNYDEEGNIKHSITTNRININKGVDAKVFQKDISQYKKIEKNV
ncbi:anti-sigma factor [Bacillus mycoides]|uniref:anti-sigma factor n=1 Tax=Bacillus mycoides TaxID=1405 RepID=UPI003D02ED42